MTESAPPIAAVNGYRGPWLTVLLSVLLGFASISTDFYLPALPTMADSLGASQGMLELTISGYLLGFSVGQLFWGAVSDRFGRKIPLLIGVAVFVAGAAGCALSGDAYQLIGWRIVQSAGASAAVVMGRAMVRDLYTRDEAARMLSTVMMIMGIAPMLGPLVGAQILAFSSWHMIFWTLTAIGTCTFIGVWQIAESHPPVARVGVSLTAAFAEYALHLRNGRLMAYVAVSVCFGAGVFAYVAGSSFVFIEVHGLSPDQYGLAFATGIVGIIIANAINRRLVVHWGSDRLMVLGTIIGATAGLMALIVTVLEVGGIVALGLSLFIYIAMNGLIVANAIAGGLSNVKRGAGSASALLGFAQYGGGLVGSAMVGILSNGTAVPMVAIISLGAGGTCFSALRLIRSQGNRRQSGRV